MLEKNIDCILGSAARFVPEDPCSKYLTAVGSLGSFLVILCQFKGSGQGSSKLISCFSALL